MTVQKRGFEWLITALRCLSTVSGSGSSITAERRVYRANDVTTAASTPLPDTSPRKKPHVPEVSGKRS